MPSSYERTSEYDECQANLEKLASWYSARAAQRNEATTRLHLIDRLFLECLGWSREDVVSEESYSGQYADYTFLAPRRMLIVEAKKEGDYFELPAGVEGLEFPIQSLFRTYPNLKAAMTQAADYCQTRGVPFGCVSNGHQAVAFIATRADGVSPFEGKAVVFPSLDFMLSRFLDLWQALSKPAVEEKKLQYRLSGEVLSRLPPKLAASVPSYPGLKGRNVFQTDLQILSELVLEDVPRSPEMETRFLEEAYCESGALSQHSTVSKAILEAKYGSLFDAESPGPTTEPAVTKEGISPSLVAESFTRRPILLLGDVGIGKTMFLRHLIKIDVTSLLTNGVVFYFDLGSRAILAGDLRQSILDEIGLQLRDDYGIDTEERNFVRGVYDLELKRFAKGIYSDLAGDNPAAFKTKEIEFLEEKLRKRDSHLRSVLEHLVRGQKRQIVFLLDNADQRGDTTQEMAFLIAQEVAEHWPATVFVSLRPETFHRSRKRGVLTAYHAKAFTIAPPRIDRVIHKRLLFGLKVANGEIPIPSVTAEVRIRLGRLASMIQVFLSSLQRNDELEEFIDNISGGNVRTALDFVRGFFGSGHVDTEKIVRIFAETGHYLIPLHEFLRGVLFGDAVHYDPDRSPIANVFEITSVDEKEHFLLPIIIGLLASGTLSEDGFVETARIYDILQGSTFTPDQIDSAIVRGYRKKLIESSARRILEAGEIMPRSLRATNVGVYHITRLCKMFSYLDAIIVDTPILDPLVRAKIQDVDNVTARLRRAELFLGYLDESWHQAKKASIFFDWSAISHAADQNIRHIRARIQAAAKG